MKGKETDIDILRRLAEDYFGCDVQDPVKLPGAGSGRCYYRIISAESDSRSCIGVAGDNIRDCSAFVNLSKVFVKAGLRVPEVFAVSCDGMHYIQQDLGDTSLFDIIRSEDADESSSVLKDIVRECIVSLVKMQCVDSKLWKDLVEYGEWGARQVKWDLNYFKYEFLRTLGVDFDEESLEDDFNKFASDICASGVYTEGFMYRDFQSRNVMIADEKPYFIDFQGGRKGPGVYDVISFLWQAKAGFSDSFRNSMTDYYFKEREKLTGIAVSDEVKVSMSGMFALFRTLQVLGAYGLRGLVEKKAHFIESIPAGLRNLEKLIAYGIADGYPELKRVCVAVCNDKRFESTESDSLAIEVFSFSYKRGYPADYSGNGGGFMFDCRGMHNPGRYPEYKYLTGRDRPVIDFLEERGEVQKFVAGAVEIVSPSVETYIRRGFSNLQIGFGCTGGQHRSVYCAEKMTEILRERYPQTKVKLIHREHP